MKKTEDRRPETEVKERPIIFSTAMVQAILAGRKTQTRRAVNKINAGMEFQSLNREKSKAHFYGDMEHGYIKCPYGQPGDHLWVREKWRPISWDYEGGMGTKVQYADGHAEWINLFDDLDDELDFHLKISDIMEKKLPPSFVVDDETFGWSGDEIKQHMPWRPSIFMPKVAARLWLKITDIQVERLQDITEEDAISEGVQSTIHGGWVDYSGSQQDTGGFANAKSSFCTLWTSINGPDAWKANPWVWVVSFKRFTPTAIAYKKAGYSF